MLGKPWSDSQGTSFGSFLEGARRRSKPARAYNSFRDSDNIQSHEIVDLSDDSPSLKPVEIKREDAAHQAIGRNGPKRSFLLPEHTVRPTIIDSLSSSSYTDRSRSTQSRCYQSAPLQQPRLTTPPASQPYIIRAPFSKMTGCITDGIGPADGDFPASSRKAPTAFMHASRGANAPVQANQEGSSANLESSSGPSQVCHESPSPPLFVGSDEFAPQKQDTEDRRVNLEQLNEMEARSLLGLDPTRASAQTTPRPNDHRRESQANNDIKASPVAPFSRPKLPSVGMSSRDGQDGTTVRGGRVKLSEDERKRRRNEASMMCKRRKRAEKLGKFKGAERAYNRQQTNRQGERQGSVSVASTSSQPESSQSAESTFWKGPGPERGLPLLVYKAAKAKQAANSSRTSRSARISTPPAGATELQEEESDDEELEESDEEDQNPKVSWEYYVILQGQAPPRYGSNSISLRELDTEESVPFTTLEEANAQAALMGRRKFASEYFISFRRSPRQVKLVTGLEISPEGLVGCSLSYKDLTIQTQVCRRINHSKRLPRGATAFPSSVWLIMTCKTSSKTSEDRLLCPTYQDVVGVYFFRELANQRAAEEYIRLNKPYFQELDGEREFSKLQSEIQGYVHWLGTVDDEEDPDGCFWGIKQHVVENVQEENGEANGAIEKEHEMTAGTEGSPGAADDLSEDDAMEVDEAGAKAQDDDKEGDGRGATKVSLKVWVIRRPVDWDEDFLKRTSEESV